MSVSFQVGVAILVFAGLWRLLAVKGKQDLICAQEMVCDSAGDSERRGANIDSASFFLTASRILFWVHLTVGIGLLGYAFYSR